MLHASLSQKKPAGCRMIHLVSTGTFDAVTAKFPAAAKANLAATGYVPSPGRIALIADTKGAVDRVLFGVEPEKKPADPMLYGRLAAGLPAGTYAFAADPPEATLATLAFIMAGYRFTRYKAADAPKARLVVPKGVDGARVSRIADAIAGSRDLINTPANDLGPDALAEAVIALGQSHGAAVREIAGKKLVKKNYPMIHAVGRAATQEPRLVDFTWGDPSHPKVTLVGKGVCFDTGGLDIKPSASMLLMKKDMGGAAAALAAAAMIMGQKLKVRLRVLIPIVENAIAGDSFRPGDVLASRKGLTVEIGNTDAEGRLILADALARADEEAPELMLDFATLTGAARVALGQELPPFFTDDEALAADIQACGDAVCDPVWRLPLWRPYDSLIDSKIADLNNAGSGAGMAGSITAALFLQRFVEKAGAYAHFDIYGWSSAPRNGMPEGGTPQAARLVLALLEKRYG